MPIARFENHCSRGSARSEERSTVVYIETLEEMNTGAMRSLQHHKLLKCS